MHGFDVILGMNWLSKYHAYIDYLGKRVVFQIPGELEFFYKDGAPLVTPIHCKASWHIISYSARKMLRKWCQTYLAYVVDAQKEMKLDDIPIVRVFSDVFLDELAGLLHD